MAVKFVGLPNDAVTTWQFSEDGISKDRSETNGGVSQLTVQGVGNGNVLGKRGVEVMAIEENLGRTSVHVASATQGPSGWSASASSVQSKLNVERVIEFMWNVEAIAAVEHYFASVGIEPNTLKIVQHSALDGRTYHVPASDGNVWASLKQWLSANSLDLNYVYDTLVVYPMDIHTMFVRDVATDWNIQLDETESTQTVSCNVYHREKSNGKQIMYPPRVSQWPDNPEALLNDYDADVISVEAGQTVEVEIPLAAELSSVVQPVHILATPSAKPTISQIPSGCYTVVGKDNKPITPAQWLDNGGGLSVEIGSDSRTLLVHVTGMQDPKDAFGPFRIAESDGSNDYSTLFVVGEGVFIDVETVTLATGGELITDPETIDNPSIDTVDKAYDALNWKASISAGYSLTLTWQGLEPLRSAFNDFALHWAVPDATLADTQSITSTPLPEKAATKWPSDTTMPTINKDHKDFMAAKSLSSNKRQAYGRISGTRFYLAGYWWRATSASYTEAGVSITASLDQKLSDWALRYPTPAALTGKTLLQLSTEGLL